MKTLPNILFIIIDALRVKNLSCYGYEKEVSPNIDDLATRGVLFADAYSCINTTDPSLTTIFSGRYPLSHGILGHGARVTVEEINRFNTFGIQLLPEILKSHGYTTLAVDWLGRWHKRGYDYYSGIQPRGNIYVFMRQMLSKCPKLYDLIRSQNLIQNIRGKLPQSRTKPYEDAKVVTDKAIILVNENKDKRFFLFIHYWDTHFPYIPPREYFEAKDDEVLKLFYLFTSRKFRENFADFERRIMDRKEEIIARYDGEISFVDHELRRLIDFLEKQSILENTFIILTSDHGESLVEHGIYMAHHGLYDETVHVPLIFVHPELPKNKVVRGFVQHFDILPTILDILNIKMDIEFDGKSILPLIEGNPIHSQVYAEEAYIEWKRMIRTHKWKYIYAPSEEKAICRWCGHIHGGVEELYDLENDPAETQNIIEKEPDVASELRDELEKWVKRCQQKMPKVQPPDSKEAEMYDEDRKQIEARLKSLGYI
ncbi:MAG: hypothetical protein DRN29_03515 [Thermoplasmata archaeon]|nr:MAG: hypothetical protein DRN29_03515 [Thermoplasmata archaeon]